MCIQVCIYRYMYIHIYIQVYVYIYVHTGTCIYICTYMYLFSFIHTHFTYTHTYTHTRTPTNAHTHTHTLIHIHTCSSEYSAEVCSWKVTTKVENCHKSQPYTYSHKEFCEAEFSEFLNFQNRYLVNGFVCMRHKSLKVSRLLKFVHYTTIKLHTTNVDSENMNCARL